MGVRMKMMSFLRMIRLPFASNNQNHVPKITKIHRIRIQKLGGGLPKVPILRNFGSNNTAGTAGATKTGVTVGSLSMFMLMGLFHGLLGIKQTPDALVESKPNEDNDELLILLVRAGAAQNRNDSLLATKLFEAALTSAETRKESGKYNESDYLKSISFINDNLANLAFSDGQFSRAETHFKKAKEICLKLGFNKSDNAIVQMDLKLATIFAMQHRTEEARTCFRSCVEEQERKITAQNDPETLTLLKASTEAYARYLFHLQDYAAAEKSFDRSIDIANSVYGPAHPETLSLINIYAMVKMARGDSKGAERTLKKALASGNQANLKEIADIQKTLGDVYLKIAQKHQATEAFQTALTIYRNTDNASGIRAAENGLQEAASLQGRA